MSLASHCRQPITFTLPVQLGTADRPPSYLAVRCAGRAHRASPGPCRRPLGLSGLMSPRASCQGRTSVTMACSPTAGGPSVAGPALRSAFLAVVGPCLSWQLHHPSPCCISAQRRAWRSGQLSLLVPLLYSEDLIEQCSGLLSVAGGCFTLQPAKIPIYNRFMNFHLTCVLLCERLLPPGRLQAFRFAKLCCAKPPAQVGRHDGCRHVHAVQAAGLMQGCLVHLKQ